MDQTHAPHTTCNNMHNGTPDERAGCPTISKGFKGHTSTPLTADSSVVDLMDDVSPGHSDQSVRSVTELVLRLLPEVAAV